MRQILFLLFIQVLLLSCARNKDPLSSLSKGCKISESQATELARIFLEKNEINWDHPLFINYVNNIYYFYYTTPENEILLVGYRGVWVNCQTLKSGFMLRR